MKLTYVDAVHLKSAPASATSLAVSYIDAKEVASFSVTRPWTESEVGGFMTRTEPGMLTWEKTLKGSYVWLDKEVKVKEILIIYRF